MKFINGQQKISNTKMYNQMEIKCYENGIYTYKKIKGFKKLDNKKFTKKANKI